jgi:hypothetical protein
VAGVREAAGHLSGPQTVADASLATCPHTVRLTAVVPEAADGQSAGRAAGQRGNSTPLSLTYNDEVPALQVLPPGRRTARPVAMLAAGALCL